MNLTILVLIFVFTCTGVVIGRIMSYVPFMRLFIGFATVWLIFEHRDELWVFNLNSAYAFLILGVLYGVFKPNKFNILELVAHVMKQKR